MRTYRTYEAARNGAGGLTGLSTGWQYVSAESAQDAAELAADDLRGIPECAGHVVVATDDAGESAESEI